MTNEVFDLITVLVIGTSVTLFLAGSIIFFVVYYQKRMLQNKMEKQQMEGEYQRKLLQTTLESQEKERKRLASELHDSVGAMLSATKLNLNFLQSLSEGIETRQSLDETKGMIDDTIETVRRISKDLLPSSLEKFGLVEALKEFCDKVSTPKTGVTFQYDDKELPVKKEQELPIYRLVQEIVNNALKHADAKTVIVNARVTPIFSLVITDNGKGFDVLATKKDINKGVGLYNIENRVDMLGGQIELTSTLGQGTTYKIVIPFDA